MKRLENLMPTDGDRSWPTLTTSSVSETSGNPAADCPICGGMGYVRYDLPVGHPDFGKLFRCPGNHGTPQPERLETLRKVGNLGAFAGKSFENFTVDLPYLTVQ